MSKRNDEHCERNFDPAGYSYVADFYQGDNEVLRKIYNDAETRRLMQLARSNDSSFFDGNFREKTTCDHCGAWFNWGTFLRHEASGKMIAVGHVCASERFALSDREKFELRKANGRRASAKRRASIEKFLLANENVARAFALSKDENVDPSFQPTARALSILNDIRSSLDRYGSLTEKQVALVLKLGDQIVNVFPKRQREREERDAKREDVPTTSERIRIRGRVISIKDAHTEFGLQYRMLVETDAGWRVFGSVPQSIWDAERDDVVEFSAKVEPSRDDPKFGFFRRPTKAHFVSRPIEATT